MNTRRITVNIVFDTPDKTKVSNICVTSIVTIPAKHNAQNERICANRCIFMISDSE